MTSHLGFGVSLTSIGRWLATALLLYCSGLPTAHASQLGVVLHGIGAGSERITGVLTHLVQELLAKESNDELVYSNAKLGASDRERAIKAFQQAYEAVGQGRKAYDNLDLQTAQEQCLLALSKYERFVAYVTDFQQLAEVLMLLAATHLLQGENETALERMQQAIGLFPSIQPDPRIFNPTMRVKFIELAKATGQGKRVALSVDSTPSGATLLLNGRFVGVTPYTFDRNLMSRDYLRVEYPGFRPFGKVLDAKQANDYALQINLRAFAQGDLFESISITAAKQTMKHTFGKPNKDLLATATQLGALLDVDQILLGAVAINSDQVDVKLVLIDLNKQVHLAEVRHLFLYNQSMAILEQEVQVFMANVMRQRQGEKAPDGKIADEQWVPALRNDASLPCFGTLTCQEGKWIILGSVMGISAGAMAAGGVFWGQAFRDHQLWRKEAQVSERGLKLASQGREAALIGDIVFGVGAAMALGTGAFMIWWDPTPPLTSLSNQPEPESSHHERLQSKRPPARLGLPSPAWSVRPFWLEQGKGVQVEVPL